ncbi:hypothetical protein L3X38_017470 [Prunus dulcis]|uniref:Uncharacterized protein n=1 Tax=Prunus dulcis TaxID=3755 RepID=A0AAD4ZA67_PRUDU|nr:hypothetical protein L3X38_017470 [Prunus dulcis]
MVQTLMICQLDRRSVLLDLPPFSKRKADVKSSRNEVATSWAKNVSPLRKKPRIPFAEKTQVGDVPCYQLGLNISLVQIARRLEVCAIFGTFHSNLLQTSLETVIYSVKWFAHELVLLLRGKE